jgi:hypothetical protein
MDKSIQHGSEPNSQNSDVTESESHRSGQHIRQMYENAEGARDQIRTNASADQDPLIDSETGERGELLRPSERESLHITNPKDNPKDAPVEGAR